MSQEELRLKIQAIFKHQSQKDSAPFPGAHDEREFWQRVEARNKESAGMLNRLGLAEYYAMEAYVVAWRRRGGAAGQRGSGAAGQRGSARS
jgi:glucosamine-6-phosphate deaminase